MSASFLNRVTGERSERLPGSLLCGQWQVLFEDDHASTVQLHGHAVTEAYSPVTPGARFEVRWAVPGSRAGHSLFDSKLIPDETTSGSVGEIVARLGRASDWGHDWKRLRQVSPVAPGISDRAQVTQFERRIAEWLHHVEAVCARPRTQLSIESERVDVSRAKRIAPGAAEHLASHTEDWHHRTLRGVEPRRVVAVTMEDNLDTYENAVAARLVDQLLDHVRRRVAEVSRVHWLLEDARRYSEQAGGTHWRQRRIYQLWGEAFVDGDDAIRGQVSRTLAMLEQLRRRLLRLLGSRLYKAVPAQRVVPATLRMTNILANDQHYKWAARLWLARREQLPLSAANPDDPARRYQVVARDWTSFVGALVARALAELNFDAQDATAQLQLGGPPLIVSNGVRELEFSWGPDGVVGLCEASTDGRAARRVRIVPLPVALSGGADPGIVEQVLTDLGVLEHGHGEDMRGEKRMREPKRAVRHQAGPPLTESEGNAVAHTLVVYPGVQQERARYTPRLRWALQTIQNDSPSGSRAAVGLVPVSPLAIDSLERLARAIRWWLAGAWLDTYPARARLGREASDLLRVEFPEAVVLHADGAVSINRRLSVEEAQRVEELLRRSPRTAGARGREPSGPASTADAFRAWWQASDARLQDLFSCLVCETEAGRHNIDVRGNDQVACSCRACGSTWGIRACGSCAARFPYLLPKSSTRTASSREPGWVDQAYGRDVLAMPCGSGEGESFHCPACGACPDHNR